MNKLANKTTTFVVFFIWATYIAKPNFSIRLLYYVKSITSKRGPCLSANATLDWPGTRFEPQTIPQTRKRGNRWQSRRRTSLILLLILLWMTSYDVVSWAFDEISEQSIKNEHTCKLKIIKSPTAYFTIRKTSIWSSQLYKKL